MRTRPKPSEPARVAWPESSIPTPVASGDVPVGPPAPEGRGAPANDRPDAGTWTIGSAVNEARLPAQSTAVT